MKLHEFQAKDLFARYGVPVPRGKVVTTPTEARQATEELGGRAVLKAQVHAGGRGLAGGIKVVQSADAAQEAAGAMLGKNLITYQTDASGVPVESLLVEELVDIAKELYIAITVDLVFRGPVMLCSASGGVDIEEVAANRPEAIFSEPIEPILGFMPYQARRLIAKLGLGASVALETTQLMSALYRIFTENDCTLVEINPLIITASGHMVALDAKLTLDDDALFRHQDLYRLRDRAQEDQFEARAADQEIAYVSLDGDVGCLVNGAGLAMATLDVTHAAGASPANFLDVGGGADEEKVASAVSIILSDAKVSRVLVNVFGGILRCDIAAKGIELAFKRMGADLPLVVRMLGTNVEEGKEILRDSGLKVTFTDTLSEVGEAIRDLS